MAERLTRGEHGRQARELLAEVRKAQTSMSDYSKESAARTLSEAQVHALLYVGDQLAALVEHSANPRFVMEPPASAFRQMYGGGFEAAE